MSRRFVMPFADVGPGISPADGAKLEFFEAGTSTPKDTFTDQALTTPNTNPVISDPKGLFGSIWLSDDAAYKVVLSDRTGSQIWEADPIDETNGEIIINASQVNYIQGGSGSVTRTVKAVFQDTVSVLDFIPVAEHAAIKDGTTSYDATADIQAAMNVAMRVYGPAGVYEVDPTVGLVFNRDGQTFYGDGMFATIFTTNSTAAGAVFRRDFDLLNPNPRIKGVLIEQVGVITNHITPSNPANPAQIAFDYRNFTRSTIQNCYAGMFSQGVLVAVRPQPSHADAKQGYGIMCGSVGSSDPAYAGGEVNRILNNIVQGAKKLIVLDDDVLSPASSAHATIVNDNDVQVGESGITQESRFTAGCDIRNNTVQSIDNMTGSTATTYAYRIEGYNNHLGGGYTEVTPAGCDFLLYLGASSKRNDVTPFLYTDNTLVITDDGKDNLVDYIFPSSSTEGSLVSRVNDFNLASGPAKAWVVFDSAGTVLQSQNVSSVSNNGAGDWSINLPSGLMSSDNNAINIEGIVNASAHVAAYGIRSMTAGTVRILTYNVINAAHENFDKTTVTITGHG